MPDLTTFGDLIEEILVSLHGYSASPDQVTSLSAAVDATSTSIPVVDAGELGRGLIEVGTELMWVQTVNKSTNTATALPKGRGWRGTAATTHALGDTVVVSPAIPRSTVAREVNNQIRALYPDVYAVNSMQFTFTNIVKQAWGVPVTADVILDVRYKDFQNNWQRVRSWEAENGCDLTDFPTGLCLRFSRVPLGRTVQVVYGSRPTVLAAETDLLSSTGLSAGAKDLLVLGSMCRVIPNLDAARLSVAYAAATEMAAARPPGSAMGVAKYFEAKYQQRLRQERAALNADFPARIHLVR